MTPKKVKEKPKFTNMNTTRVGTPVQVFAEGAGFLPGQISKVQGSTVDVIALTPEGVLHIPNISHADFYAQGSAGWFWRHVPQEHVHSEVL